MDLTSNVAVDPDNKVITTYDEYFNNAEVVLSSCPQYYIGGGTQTGGYSIRKWLLWFKQSTIDKDFGETELSFNPSNSIFDVRFINENLGNGVKKDIRKSTYDSVEYIINIQRAPTSSITISWSNLPEGSFILQNMTEEALFTLDMNSINKITITNVNIKTIKIIASLKNDEQIIQPPSNLQVSDMPGDYGHRLKLTWSASPSEEEGLVSWYRIFRSRSGEPADPIPLPTFTSLDWLNSWEEHYTILIDSVAAGTTEYIDTIVPLSGTLYYYWVQAVGDSGAGKKAPFGIATLVEETPSEFYLSPPYPNPFNPSTTFRYSVPQDCHVKLIIYDILGRKAAVIKDRIVGAGNYEVTWAGRNDNGTMLGSGVYLYRFTAGNYQKKGKMMLMR